MRYKLFGKSGLRVSELALGTMTFGTEWGWGLGTSPGQVAIRWTMQRGSSIIPLIGATKPEQFQESLGAANFSIPPQMMQQLDEMSAIDLGFPHDFLNSDGVKGVVFGGTYDLIEHRER